jgi:hypothetical protein
MVDPDFTVQPVYKAIRRAAGLYQGPGALVPTPTAGAAATATPATGAVATETPATGAVATDTPATGAPTATTAPAAAETPTVAPTAIPPAGATGGDNTALFVAGAVLLLAGIAGVVFYMMRRTAS